MTLLRRLAVGLVIVVAGCGTEEDFDLDDVGPSASYELKTNSDPKRLVVYSNNIENMIFDWKDLVHAMEEAPLRPDIFLVQQVSGKAELDRLIRFMNARLGVRYEGRVAQNNPDDRRFSGDVIPRPKVTTGIIYRAARFDVVNRDNWMPFGRGFAGQNQSCDNRSNHSGYETLRLKLHDKVANEDVIAVSLRHWTWQPCSLKNFKEIVNGHDGGPNDHAALGDSAALHIVGGDFNERGVTASGAYKCWYRQMVRDLPAGDCGNVNLGFTDPLFESCNGERSCVRKRGGIDSLMVRRPDGGPVRTDHFDVVSFEQAHNASRRATGGDGPSNLRKRDGYRDVADRYSGHEARRAYVYYR